MSCPHRVQGPKNIKYIDQLTCLSPWDYSGQRIKEQLPVQNVPEEQQWRLGLIEKLLDMRNLKHICAVDHTQISAWLDSLCST